MSSKQDLQLLYDAAHHHAEQTKAVQNGIKRLNSAKKDSEIKQHQEALLKLIESLNGDLKKFQGKASTVQKQLESTLGTSHEESGRSDNKNAQNSPATQSKTKTEGEKEKKRLPDPADQENAYQLKAQMMPQIHSQNKHLQTEIILRLRRNELRSQRKERQVNYNRETNLSAATTLHVIQMHERKAREAEARAAALQAELDKYEGRQPEADKRNGSKSADGDRSQSFLGPNNRVNDVIRRNEVLSEENVDQQREIQRLRRENAELIKKAKHAQQDRHQILCHLSTSEKARKDQLLRMQKQKAEHDRLSRSLTRQSSDWIESKKQENQEEEEIRWRNVGHAAPHGSHARTFSHAVPRNVDQPRYMFPVERYAETSAA